MTDVAKETRAQLAEAFSLNRPEVVERQVSKDGTRKWLIRMEMKTISLVLLTINVIAYLILWVLLLLRLVFFFSRVMADML